MKHSSTIKAGTGEKDQYMVHDFNDNTIRFIVCYNGQIDPDTLKQAAKALAGSVDILHSSFETGKHNAYWQVNEEYPEEAYFSLRKFSETGNGVTQECPDPLMDAAIQVSLLPIYPEGKTQLHCTLLQSETKSTVIFRVSHLCVDGSDGRYLLYKLMEAYRLIRQNGTAEGLTVKNGSRAPEQAYENLSREEVRSLISNPLTGVKTEFPFPTEEPGEKRMVWTMIPQEIMEAAGARAKSGDPATVNDVLLTACYHAYAALPGTDAAAPLSIQSFMDLRRHCKGGDSEGLCNLSGSLATVLPDGIGENFSDTLREVADQTRAAKEEPLAGLEGMPLLHGITRAVPLNALVRLASKVYGSFSIGLTNIGNLDREALEIENCSLENGIFGGPTKKKNGAQVCAASFGGTAALSVYGEFTETDARLLQEWLDRMAAEVKLYAENG